MIEQLKYRSQHGHNVHDISDVFDGSVYQDLLRTRVVVDGTQLSHTFFSDSRDIVFGGSTDGFRYVIFICLNDRSIANIGICS